VVGLLLYGVLSVALLSKEMTFDTEPGSREEMTRTTVLGESLMSIDGATAKANITGVPKENRKERTPVGYLLPFEIVSVHLLVVLIGAAYLARAKRRATGRAGGVSPPMLQQTGGLTPPARPES